MKSALLLISALTICASSIAQSSAASASDGGYVKVPGASQPFPHQQKQIVLYRTYADAYAGAKAKSCSLSIPEKQKTPSKMTMMKVVVTDDGSTCNWDAEPNVGDKGKAVKE